MPAPAPSPSPSPKPKPKPAPTPAPAPTPPPAPAAGASGAKVFADTCAKCHGADGQGHTKIGDKLRAEGKEFPPLGQGTLAAITAKIRDGVPGTGMKAYGAKLSPDELAAVAQFVKSL